MSTILSRLAAALAFRRRSDPQAAVIGRILGRLERMEALTSEMYGLLADIREARRHG